MTARVNGSRRESFPKRTVLPRRLKPDSKKGLIAAVNRCATQKQMQYRILPQAMNSCPPAK